MRRDILAGVGPTTLTKRWFVDGAQSDVGTVTFAVLDGAGVTVVAGTATKTGAGATTVYTIVLPVVADPTVLRIRWTRSDTAAFLDDWLEVAGSILFTEVEARTKQTAGQQAPLASEAAYPDDVIATWRLKVGEAFEGRTGRSWVRRYCRIEAAGDGTHRLLPAAGEPRISLGNECGGPGRLRDIRRVLSVTVDGTPVSPGNIRIVGSGFQRVDGVWPVSSPSDPLNVAVEYEYGIDPTWEAHENGLRAVVALAPPQSTSAWAVTLSDDAGSRTFELAWPPKVWEWLKSADRRIAIA